MVIKRWDLISGSFERSFVLLLVCDVLLLLLMMFCLDPQLLYLVGVGSMFAYAYVRIKFWWQLL